MGTGAVKQRAVQQRRPVRRNVFMVQRPASLQVDEPLPCSVAADECPSVLRVYAVRRGIEVALIDGAGIIRCIDDWIRPGLVNIRRLNAVPAQKRLDQRNKVGLGWRINVVECAEVSRLVRRIHLHRAAAQFQPVGDAGRAPR